MAEQQLQNTSNVDTTVTSKAALVTDLNPSYVGKEQYSHARNVVRNSKDGDLGTVGNEPSTIHCFNVPYKIIGTISLPDDKVMYFSTDEVHSEIGIGDSNTCTYTTLYNNSCLGFSKNFPIDGEAKNDQMKGTIITFISRNQPMRRFELNKLKVDTPCDDILLFKKIDQPCITAKRGQAGNVPNGMFSVVIAYVVDNQVFSDWYSVTNRVQLHSETGTNSIEVTIEGLDTEFDSYALGVIGTYIEPNTKSVTKLGKQIGIFSTKVRTVSISDFLNPLYPNIPLSNFVLQKRTWQKAGIVSSNANVLIFGDLVGRDEENYQLKALSIKARYVVEQVPADYYEMDGRDVSFYRDENYDFYIQGVYSTGELTDKFHIPGREATSSDLASAVGTDVYEFDKQFSDCEPKTKVPRWQVENTASKMRKENNDFFCKRRVIGKGDMGYHQSTINYPDNVDMFGEKANTPQLYHRMPDECKVPRYSRIDGKFYVNILGVEFYNIPKFDSPDIVGYKITRSDRKGGNGTVLARGLMTNVRSYNDPAINQTVLYGNYPVNDLRPDTYLSSTQTVYKNKRETNFTPLTDFHLDKFTFYSPHTLFEPRASLGPELKIESEEIAEITGKFEIVHNHPKQKLMNQFAFWLSAAVGFVESTLILGGRTDLFTKSGLKIGIDGGPYYEIGNNLKIYSFDDLIKLRPGELVQITADAIKAADPTKILTIINLITSILQTITALALKGAYAALGGIKVAQDIFDTIYNFTGFTDYVYQYNAHALFTSSICSKVGHKRRRLLQDALYIPPSEVTIDDKIFNNRNRERSVYLELNKPINVPVTEDTSRGTIGDFGLCGNPTDKVKSTGSAFYATSKAINPNQYGQLGSGAAVSMHSCVLPFEETLTSSPIIYGGDCVITRFQFQKRMQFFSQNIANTNFPPGTEYDYRKYGGIAYPRYWIDSTKYDFSELLTGRSMNFARFTRTTSSKHNLDCTGDDKRNIARIDDAYMYLANNVAMDFFVEADYNPDWREEALSGQPYFSKKNQNLSDIFRSDRWTFPEEFNISRAYQDLYTTEIYANQQRFDFDPNNPIPVQQPNAVIFSLPSFNLQSIDNWQYFLPANYFDFRDSDYGKLTGIHKLDQDRIIFLFSKASPFITMGRSLLQLSNQTVTVGDGGLFAQDPREIMPTDNNYAACNSRYAFSNTHMGRFYPSEKQGRIINYTTTLDDITRQGVSYWCKNYMPIFLYKYFPAYPQNENPVAGVGYLTAFDSFTETIYICKRDFVPKREYVPFITYVDNQFYFKDEKVDVRDLRYFNDVSWTLSYSPLDKGFVSWHDWHPDWIVQRDNHFLSIKDRGVWKHNEAYDSYCTFYNVEYPWEIEPTSSSGQQVETVRSIEYILECYRYKNFGRDRFHILNENFDYLIVSNSEQISPVLHLLRKSTNPEADIFYPIKDPTTPVTYDILFSKEENKYRINQFWDATRDRGEFSLAELHLFPTDESGYKQVVNPVAVDMDKPEEQRKKFRHYYNRFRLIKSHSGSTKMLFKILNIKKLLSLR